MKILEKKIKFYNKEEIPQIGLGTYKLTDEKETYNVIIEALKLGYRHIDTAQIYKNHKVVAKAIKDSGVPRKEIFITSKIWNDKHDYEGAKEAINTILNELELDYIDLLLIHWPTEQRLECWKAMEESVSAGQAKSIGVSNFLVPHLEELLDKCSIKPVINQIELHPALQCWDLVQYCQYNNIVVESWRTMMMGKCFEVEQIVELAKKYNKTEPQICLRWAFQQDYVIIPKTSKPSRLSENIDIDDFELSDDDMELLSTIPELRDGPDPANFDF
ncbi:aldo/keto reductase [Spiroplasma chinense]|uniref:Aldo/keto reductase n=1 Tax=Spiroplasma chinense TaxID=216932 RepID=A0A5B9Y675_9MOLU|nr:aldo/keto reductase [Spiroplasma chinense]QEH62199.1 aldo/keto reductase [Spiroplasma chinense]